LESPKRKLDLRLSDRNEANVVGGETMTSIMRPMKGLISAAVLVLLGTCASVGVLKADVNFYAETVFSGTFGILDGTTGVFTQISTGNPSLAGLAMVNGTLYGTDYESGGQLYSINTATGAYTPVGTASGLSYYDFGGTATGLYALSFPNLEFYSINTTTGAATDIGPSGLPSGGLSQLTNNSSALYVIETSGLYTVNPTTGSTTFVANTNGYDSLSFVGGTLYGAGSLPGTIDTIDTTTGATTTGPAITGFNPNDTAVFGMAAVTTPEPGAVFTLGLALAGLASALRIKKAKVTA